MRIGELIAAWRQLGLLQAGQKTGERTYGVRAIARQIGISHGTLSRIERGEDFDSQTLAKIMVWMFNEEVK